MHRKRLARAAASVLFSLFLPSPLLAETFDVLEDRWVYPFNGTPGFRNNAPLFGALDPADTVEFDDADGTFHFSFDTGSAGGGFTPGQGASQYDVASARITLTSNVGSPGWLHDPSFDAFDDQDGIAPIELYGAGYRNGFDTLSFLGTSPFAPPGSNQPRVRNVFPTDDGVRDVGNYVRDGFDPSPFAIGQVAGLDDGDPVAAGTPMTFDLDVADPTIRAYLQSRLDLGELDFVVISLYASGGIGGNPIPRFDTREEFGGVGPMLEITLASVAEPASAWLCVGGLMTLGLLAGARPVGRR